MRHIAFVFLFFFSAFSTALAADPFDRGWDLQSEASNIRFQSVKNGSKVEISSFATFSGGIAEDGTAEISVLLDSVDTKVDLRNVRMRFLFFETFQYPAATVSVKLDPAELADLDTTRRKVITLPYKLDLHGISKEMSADLALTLIGDDLIAVSTNTPITLEVADFDLTGGVKKLEEAANVTIVPSATVTFDLIFQRRADDEASVVTAAVADPSSAALEEEGNFSREACLGRFEILSRTGNIYFATGSARLQSESEALLSSLFDIVSRCPDLTIEIGGHTDSVGADSANRRLSEARAASVANWLSDKGIEQSRFVPVGYGEARPIASNDTNAGRSQNRRIEFSVSGG